MMNVVVSRGYASNPLAIPVDAEALAAERNALSGSIVESERESFAEFLRRRLWGLGLGFFRPIRPAIIFVKVDPLINFSITITIKLTYMSTSMPVSVIDLTIAYFNFFTFPALKLSVEDLPTFS